MTFVPKRNGNIVTLSTQTVPGYGNRVSAGDRRPDFMSKSLIIA